MNNTVFQFDVPLNETMETYAPGTAARARIQSELARQAATEVEIPLVIGGREIRTGRTGKVVMPCDHGQVLATYHKATEKEVALAIASALKAKEQWEGLSWIERASITLKAADLLSRKHRDLINAATMLGQAKNVHQAEVDAARAELDAVTAGAGAEAGGALQELGAKLASLGEDLRAATA